jgi:hypothetical protein
MIALTQDLAYNEALSFDDQPQDVKDFFIPVIDNFNSINCIEFDEFDRPLKWRYETDAYTLNYTRVYVENTHNRMIDHLNIELIKK